MLTKDIGKNVSGIGVEQQRVKRTLDDQHKIVNNTSSNVRTIVDKQSSLVQSIATHYMKTRDQMFCQSKVQENAFSSSGKILLQLQRDVQDTASQTAQLMALEQSISG